MKRIYTRTGDKGTTAIHGGERVSKTDIRIEANGELDELNTAIGTVRALLSTDHNWQNLLREVQINLMSIMSLVATPSKNRHANPNFLPETIISDIESYIDEITAAGSDSQYFILPGGTTQSAAMHTARVLARRAERRLWSLHAVDPLPENILKYVNRLSDLFFIMARHEMSEYGFDEERWKSFTYKRNSK